MNISLIIPTLGYSSTVNKLFIALSNQTLLPDEIIIVDSSKDKSISNLADLFHQELPIKYFKVKDLFPGEARNYGINKASGDILATLDSKTIPNNNWLELGVAKIVHENYEIAFGATAYLAESSLQKILRACIYGKNVVETLPGSIFWLNTFNKVGPFIEGTRSGEDLEWRNRVKHKGCRSYSFTTQTQTYNDISTSLVQEIKRAFIYQLHGAKLDVQERTRIVFFGLGTLMLTLLIPQWNNIVGWEESSFYIPNITKSYFYFFSLFSILVLIVSHKFHSIVRSIYFRFVLFSFFILATFFVFKWNAAMASWVEESVYYIPHITKLYVGLLITSGIIFRGLYKPISKGISYSYLFPLRWILVGAVGLTIDLARFPGYFYGAITGLIRIGKK